MTGPPDIKKDLYVELSQWSKWYLSHTDNKISIEQVAHSISSIPRFHGHCKWLNGHTYTLAEHSVKVSYLVPTLTALMHDAHESIINDLSKPVKTFVGKPYEDLEAATEKQFAQLFNLDYPMPPEIKEADILMVLIESFDLLESKGSDWFWFEQQRIDALKLYVSRPELRAECWSPTRAYEIFMKRYEQLEYGHRDLL